MDQQLLQEIDLLYTQVCQGMGDPKRLAIMYALAHQPRYVGELAEELDLPQPTVSRHLKILRDRSLVESSREGNAVYYAIKDRRIIEALDTLRAMLRDRLAEQAELAHFSALEQEQDED